MEYLKIVTVKQAVESKGKEYREPDVGKRLKGEKHPLADATTFVSWMQLKQIKRRQHNLCNTHLHWMQSQKL